MPSQLRVVMGPVVFTPPYFDELIKKDDGTNPKGRLPPDVEAHALWYYYVLAANSLKGAKENLVYEDELSKHFDVPKARRLLERVAFMYGSVPARMVRYWEAVDKQRIALGFSSNAELPAVMKFRFN